MNTSLKTFFITLLYIAVGCVFYRAVEKKQCESEDRLSAPDYDEEECVEPWTVIDALYFSMVTMSTVGYGDLTPTSDLSKAFTCLYIIVGISVVFVRIANALGGVLEKFEEFFNATLKTLKLCQSGRQAVDLDGDGDADLVVPPSSQVYWVKGLTSGCVVLALIQIVSAIMFMQLQADLQFGDAMYHCFVTATTVGYGDVPLTTQESRFWAFCHIALSVACLGAFISRVGELQEARVMQLQHYQLLCKQMDMDLICSLDQDGSGVDKLEFVMGMLIKLGAQLCGSPLEWSDVAPFLIRFDAMDVDKSGHLSKKDLQIMAEQAKTSKGFFKQQSVVDSVKTMGADQKLTRADTKLKLSKADHMEETLRKVDCMDDRLASMDEALQNVLKFTQGEMPDGPDGGQKSQHKMSRWPNEGMPSSDAQEGSSETKYTNALNTIDQKLKMIVECMQRQHPMSQHERSQHQMQQGPNGGPVSWQPIPQGTNEGMSSLNILRDSSENTACHSGSLLSSSNRRRDSLENTTCHPGYCCNPREADSPPRINTASDSLYPESGLNFHSSDDRVYRQSI